MDILGVCGDSFLTSTINESGCGPSFVEMLAEKLKCKLVTFARSGISNQAIRLQIDEIIKYNPKHVIIGTTSPDRIEIPIKDSFKKELGIYNIDYYPKELSFNNTNFSKYKPTLLSGNISTFLTDNNQIDDDTKNSIWTYINYLYDYNWKKLMDSWIISDGLKKLEDHNIKYNVIISELEFDIFSDFVPNKVIYHNNDLCPQKYYEASKDRCVNHLDQKTHEHLAELWYEYLKNVFYAKNNKIL